RPRGPPGAHPFGHRGPRTAPPQPEVRHGDDVRGHRPGCCRHLREGVMRGETLAFSADDGTVALSGRYYAPQSAVKAVVLIAGAMGVKQDYYAEFAQWLAARGYAALSFDYRGTGES